METISQNQIINVLNNVEKGTFTYLVMATQVRTTIKHFGTYHNRIIKITKGRYYLGGNYEQRVNNNMMKEGMEPTFQSEQPKGKHHISKCVLLDDKTNSIPYLMIEPYKEIPTKKTYLLDGQEVTQENNPIVYELIKSFEQQQEEKNYSSRQEQDRKVLCITPKLENNQEIHINGHQYQIID